MKYTIIFLTVLFALFCRAFLISVYKVPTHKMAPAILSGEYVLASKASFGIKFPWSEEIFLKADPQHGDLVVYSKDSKILIKRVIAVGLDEVEFNNGEFSVNSVKCNYTLIEITDNRDYSLFEENCGNSIRKIYRSSQLAKTLATTKIKLDAQHVFVANDHRNIENDPDSVEQIAIDQIIGKPLFVWMSYSSTQDFISKSLGIRSNRILTKLK